jgi:drug/metabolite transporter (DMT)-like permease
MIVVLLAFLAAGLSALSAAGEHRAASRLVRRPKTAGTGVDQPSTGTGAFSAGPPGGGRAPIRRGRWPQWVVFVLALVTTPLWVASWAVDVGAFFVQAAALHLGSLAVVQPLMVSTLVFTLPLAAVECRRWPGRADWVGTLVVSAGLALILSTRRSETGAEQAGPGLYPALVLVVAGAAVLVVATRGRSAAVRTTAFGVAAGGLFGVGAALSKLTAGIAVDGGLIALATSWPGYALAAVSMASFVLQQKAYADGRLATVMTAVVIFDPLTSYMLGVVGFGEPLPAPGMALALGMLGLAMLVAGVAVLARSPLLRLPRGRVSSAGVPSGPTGVARADGGGVTQGGREPPRSTPQ